MTNLFNVESKNMLSSSCPIGCFKHGFVPTAEFSDAVTSFPSCSIRERALNGNVDAKMFVEETKKLNLVAFVDFGYFNSNRSFTCIQEAEFGLGRVFRIGFANSKTNDLSYEDEFALIHDTCEQLCDAFWNVITSNYSECVSEHEDGSFEIEISNDLLAVVFDSVDIEVPVGSMLIIHEWLSSKYVIIR